MDWLLNLNDRDFWTARDAFEGTQIFGATGSGKTSGSGQAIACALLESGFGGLVLTAKRDERELWQKYALKTGRQEDLIIFGATDSSSAPYTFNFLEYERTNNREPGVSLTDNLVALFCAVAEVAQRGGGQGGGNQDGYWLLSLKLLLRNAIDLLTYAKQSLNFQNIHRVITTAAPTLEAVRSESWQEESFCWKCVAAIDVAENDPLSEDVAMTENYWLREYPGLAPETRSIVTSYFSNMADPFLRGTLKRLFSPTDVSGNQLKPELSHEGRIIVLDLPVKQYNEMGQFAQVLYKYIWQRATERRDVKATGQRPVFLWADEAQFFVNSHDMMFQTTARASQTATVYLTQNISNYYAIMPGEKGRAETDSLLGNFQTKIFHANGDSVTNLWAADVIGKFWDTRHNRSTSISSRESDKGGGASSQFSSSQVEHLEHQVLPIEFTQLKKGGTENDRQVQAVLFQGGRRWSTSRNFIRTWFRQQDLPEPTANVT
jgi:hypothetical protein